MGAVLHLGAGCQKWTLLDIARAFTLHSMKIIDAVVNHVKYMYICMYMDIVVYAAALSYCFSNLIIISQSVNTCTLHNIQCSHYAKKIRGDKI